MGLGGSVQGSRGSRHGFRRKCGLVWRQQAWIKEEVGKGLEAVGMGL